MNGRQKMHMITLERELMLIKRKEKQYLRSLQKKKNVAWKIELEKRIPQKGMDGLKAAFSKGFALVFKQGRAIIERSYDKDTIKDNHAIWDFAFQVKGTRNEIREIRKSALRSHAMNMALTTVEGVGLGILGVGLPDIVLFIAMLLRGVYETALHYGFDYESPYEQYLILKMMAASLASWDEIFTRNAELDSLMMQIGKEVTEEELAAQMEDTAGVFAMDMLVLKFIQGLPVVGIVGGAANPLYYHKIMNYVQLQYQKRFLEKLLGEQRARIG